MLVLLLFYNFYCDHKLHLLLLFQVMLGLLGYQM